MSVDQAVDTAPLLQQKVLHMHIPEPLFRLLGMTSVHAVTGRAIRQSRLRGKRQQDMPFVAVCCCPLLYAACYVLVRVATIKLWIRPS